LLIEHTGEGIYAGAWSDFRQLKRCRLKWCRGCGLGCGLPLADPGPEQWPQIVVGERLHPRRLGGTA